MSPVRVGRPVEVRREVAPEFAGEGTMDSDSVALRNWCVFVLLRWMAEVGERAEVDH